MKYFSYTFIAVLLAAVVMVMSGAAFTVGQTQQVLLLRLGQPVPGRTLITDAGLHFKIPFIETAVFLDKRILDVETPKQEVLAADNNRIEVDAFLRYRIVDPLKFYQSVGSMAGADQQLANIMNSAVRRVLGEASMQDIVREKRAQLMAQIRTQVDVEANKFGLQIKDVRIRRADLPRQISEKVFSRMQTERAREAAEFRAQGAEQAQRITAKADRDVIVLRAQAQQQAEQIRGQGDGERNRIFAEAYGKDPEFFAFYRSMQAYEAGLKAGETRLVLNPSSEFFRYFQKSLGAAGTVPAK